MKVIITCAGTGGHINPAIAIANIIKKYDSSSEILFIGRKEGMELDLVSKSGCDIKSIRTGKLFRKLTFKNVLEMYNAYKGIQDSYNILKEFKPDICIGTGGYICVPVMKAAKKLNIPYILHESNSYPGLSVKILSKNASKVLCGFEKTIDNLKYKDNSIYTGTPCKIDFNDYNKLVKDECKQDLNIELDKKVVFITFGSQGAKFLNYKMLDMIFMYKNKNILYILVTGENNYNDVLEYIKLKEIEYDLDYRKYLRIEKFIYDMSKMYKVADMCITRAGALTVTELSITKVPVILIPLPYASENHQFHNASIIKNVKAGSLIEEKSLNITILNDYIVNTIYNEDKLKTMSNNYDKITKLDVDETILNEIVKVVKG